jgi:tetratricopeptide (TPR) repeat protein
MVRTTFAFVVAATLLLTASLTAQTIYQGDSIATTPDALRRVPPPDPKMSAADLETRADELRGQKLFADAVDYFKAAIKKEPTAQRYNKMGIAELQMRHDDDAKKLFEKALKLDPKYPEARNNLGVSYFNKKNYKKATKNYEKAIELKPDSASFYSNLGTAYFSRKQFEKALVAYNKALELDPEVFDRTSRTGVSLMQRSAKDRAQYSYVIAKSFAMRGDTEKCLLYLRKAIEDGFPVQAKIAQDEEFAQIRNDKRLQELLAEKLAVIPDDPRY